MDFIYMEIMYMIAYDVYCLYIFRAHVVIPYMLNCHCVQNKLICIMNTQQELPLYVK